MEWLFLLIAGFAEIGSVNSLKCAIGFKNGPLRSVVWFAEV
ncbi:hypothetical protein [Siminovitchia terrae]|nr:hypothetical protein [Siminovitchia terrae]